MLALRELEATTRTGAAVLLALDLAGIAGEQPGLLQGRTERGVRDQERTGHAEAHRTALPGLPTALDRDDRVVGLDRLGEDERLHQVEPVGLAREVVLERAAVHLHATGAGAQEHAGGGGLAATGSVV